MAAAGMSPAAVLHAATASAAELCGLADVVGTVRPGLLADLVVISGDPYDLTALPEHIEQIWQSGVRVDHTVSSEEFMNV